MPKKAAQSDPALAIEFWLSGFYTHRSQLFAPFKGIGVNVVSFHDPVIDGANMEDTDLFEWSRRPGFSIFCPVVLNIGEIVDEFYSFRNFSGNVIALFDSNQRIAQFTDTTITSVIPKTTANEGFISAIGDMMYFSDGASVDMQKWDSAEPFSTINPSSWGLPAPTLAPAIFNRGCWLPKTDFVINNAILDPNGNVEVVTAINGVAGISGANEPLWPTTVASTINDGTIQWTNMGPLTTWLPNSNYPVPVVVLDTNGNLQLATTTTSGVTDWDAATAYTVGETVFFGGNYWTALVANVDVPPTGGYIVTTGAVQQPYWVLSQNPIVTGPVAPTWSKMVGGTTVDGSYTWTNIGPGQLTESFGTSYVYAYRTIYGHLSTSSPISINTGAIFGPTVAAITAYSVTGNVVTFFGTNNFIPGNVFTVEGLAVGTFLNNQSFTVIAAGLSPTQWSAVFNYPDVAATIDSGSTLNLVAQVTGAGNTSPLCNAVVSITATSVLAGIVTVYAVNDFVPGLQVTFAGVTVATFLNGQQFQITNVDPLGTWFQVYFATLNGALPPNQIQTTDSGTATFNAIEIYRTSDGGGIYLFTGAVTNPTGTIVTPYDTGYNTAGLGTDNGVPGTFPWTNPNNVTSTSLYATDTIPTPISGSGNFIAVQSCQNIASGTGSNITQASFGFNVTGGNSIVASVVTYDVTSWSLTDSQGNIYNLISSVALPNDHGVTTLSVYKADNVAAGPTTVKLTVVLTGDNNDFFGFGATECSGLTGVVDAVNSNLRNTSSGGGATFDTGSVTTGNAHDVVLTFLYSDLNTNSGNSASAPGAFTLTTNQVVFDPADGNSFHQLAAAYQAQTATGTFDPTWSTPAQSKTLGVTLALELALYAPSDGLNATMFDFTVPPDIAVSGIEVDFEGLFTGTPGFGVYSVQLLRSGAPFGAVFQVLPTNSNQTFVLGGPGNLWGGTWAYSDFNSSTWGVQITASQLAGGTNATFSVRNVRARLTGSTSTSGWVLNDFTTDGDLDILLIAPQNHLNDPPPGAPGSTLNTIGTLTAYWNGRFWMAVGNYVYFDAGPDCTNGVPEESWPPANRFKFVGPVLGLQPTADGVGLIVMLADRYNAILGGPETISFYPTDFLSNFGISNPNAIFRDSSVIGQFTTQKQYFEITGIQKNEIGERVSDYIAANFDPTKTYVTMHRDGLDVGMFLSNGVDQVLRYGTNMGAWSVPSFPVGGAGAIRSIETTVGITSLMLASPIASAFIAVGPQNPSSGISVPSANVAWLNPENITLNNPIDYATANLGASQTSQILRASKYSLNVPPDAIISGVRVAVTGKQLAAGPAVPYINYVDPNNIFTANNATSSSVTINPAFANWQLSTNYYSEQNQSPNFNNSRIIDTNGNIQTVVVTGSSNTVSQPVWATLLGATTPDNTVLWRNDGPGNIIQIGDLLFISAVLFGGHVLTLTDSMGNTWLPASTLQGNGSVNMQGWYTFAVAALGSGASYTLNATFSTNTYTDGNSTFIAVSSIDALNTSVGASGTAMTYGPGNLTTLSTQMLLNFTWSNGTVGSTPAGYAVLNQVSGNPDTVLSFDVPVAGTYNPQTTGLSPFNFMDILVAFTIHSTTGTGTLTISPSNPAVGAESDTFSLGPTNTTVTFGGPTDMWGMPWISPFAVNAETFGFDIVAMTLAQATLFSISEVQVTVFYGGTYLRARDITTWADNGHSNSTDGTPYPSCFVTVGSVTLSQLGAPMFPLQHVVGYFDAVGTLRDGGPSYPDIWILPNEISDKAGIGFVYLPSEEILQEPPTGQNEPSASLLALRWPVNMMNSSLASQFVHHLQVKIQFEPENAPNTIKAISFKENQD